MKWGVRESGTGSGCELRLVDGQNFSPIPLPEIFSQGPGCGFFDSHKNEEK